LKHRRRYTTQTTKKKNSRIQYQTPYDSSSKGSSKFWRYFFILIILSGGIYYLISHLNKPSSVDEDNFSDSELIEEEQTAQPQNRQAFPVEEKKIETPPINRTIQLEVLNGCGTQGVAKIFSKKLKSHKYDVVSSGNYLKNGKTYWKVLKTKIIDNTGNRENAEKLSEIIGIDSKYIESKITQSPIADITIVIGKDYRDLALIKKK
jgi:hypothetical protein